MPRTSVSTTSLSLKRCTLCVALIALTLMLCSGRSQSEEPAQKFVEQLRAQGYYAIAIRYLERIAEYPGVSPDFLSAIPLEIAQTKLEAAQQSRLIDQRDRYFAEAATALQTFIDQQSQHPRRAEARMQLGNLQLLRGAQLMELGGEPTPERRQGAKEAFLGAASTFNAIVADLRTTLEGMQGQKIDAQAEPEKAALRDRYRAEYLQGLLMSGDATKRAAETFATPDAEQRQLFDDALNRFLELRDKNGKTIAGVLATLYAAEIQFATGQSDLAIANFLSVLDQPANDVIRLPKVKAATGLMRLYLAQSPPNFQEAINRGQPWADDIRPSERRDNDFSALRVVLAEAYLGQSNATENAVEKRRFAGFARELLLAVSKIPGPSQAAASEKLATLGINLEAGSALEKPVTFPAKFAETMALVNELLEEEKSLTLASQLLEQRGQAGEDIAGEREKSRQALKELRNRGVDLLRHAITLNEPDLDNNERIVARSSLAFLLYRSERFREAAVVGEFVARRYPANEVALSSGLTAQSSWQYALKNADPQQTQLILNQLQRVAEFLVQQWPNAPECASAKELLVRVAIGRNDFAAAKQFLAALPDENIAKTELQRAMGRLMWNQSIKLQQEEDSAGAQALRMEAIAVLQAGLAPLKPEGVDASALEAALLLARLQMLADQSAAALTTLDSDVYGPLKRLDQVSVPNTDFRGDVFALALQAIVSQLTAGGADNQALMQRASTVMEGLQQAYKDQPEGEQKLAATYFRLARDIRQQLETAPSAQKQRLLDAFQLFLSQLAQATDDSKTLHWAGQTLLGLGQAQMTNSDAKATGQAETLIRSASSLLQRIAERGSREPNWLASPTILTQIRLELGTAARLVGEYKTALDALTEVLSANQNLIDAQVEAALVYEQWAATLQPSFAAVSYGRAIAGAKPDPKTGRNIVWGWGGIAKRTMGNSSFETVFFNARYHLALSRYLQGKKEADAAAAKKLIDQSSEDIRNVFVRYPELGGKASYAKFDNLLREIQKTQSKSPSGLAEFQTTGTNP